MNRINRAASVKGPDRPTAAIPLDGPARDTRPVSVSANASARARERILDAAQKVFGNRGFNSGSLNEIANGAGLTRAGVLHHFPSKQAILIALLDRRDAELAELAPVEPQVVPLDQLLTEIAPGIRVILADRQLVQLAHILTAEASGDEHPAHEWVAVRHRRLRATIRAAAARSLELGELDPRLDPDVVAGLVLAVVEGAENQWLLDPGSVDPEQIMTTLRRLLGPPG